MGRMNQSTFKTLFEYGKKVYQGDMDLSTAAEKASTQSPEVAISSARHYITWYAKMRTGEFLTWNSNSDLLLYYARRITEEEGIAAGQLAIQSAKQFAKHVSRHDLERDLDKLAQEVGITSLGAHFSKEASQKEAFREWLKKTTSQEYTDHTIYKYLHALEMAEEWLSIKLEKPILFISKLDEFEKTYQEIKSVQDFEEINQSHGHGDLSAALTAYRKYLTHCDEERIDKNSTTQMVGQFDSWEIIDKSTAIKHCDKSFFEHNGSGVPKGISWFFDADIMKPGEAKQITLMFGGKPYQGRVANDSTDRRRVRIFWSTELGNMFNIYNVPEAAATFKKIADDTYEVFIKGGEKEMTIKEKVAAIKAYVAAKGFNYADGLIENFYLSLKSKPFVILAGTSGTGKTRLVKLFAEAVGATTGNGRYKMVSVRPDWSDSSDLFGHVDLNGKFIPGAIIDFVKQAEIDNNRPYFLCLDEMNLARVEYYLSDILSVIETRDFVGGTIQSDPLVSDTYYGSDTSAAGRYGTVRLPENLYIIGTVNMDETTFPFSRKVLDRANTIEFSYVDLMPNLDELPREMPQAMNLNNAFLKTEYLLLGQCAAESETVNGYCLELQKVNRILQKSSAHVGYRVRDEIVFYLLDNKKYDLLAENEAMDNELMQKILPRIQGSNASVKAMLCELFKFCAGDYDGYQVQSDNISDKMRKALNDAGRKIKYRHSAEKIELMTRRFEEDGFTSYWL